MATNKSSHCTALFFLLISVLLSAQPAPMDSTFGVNGIVQLQYGFSSLLRDMELLPDGKILIAGGTPSETYLARFGPDGSLDNSFGNNGIVVSMVGNIGLHHDLVMLPDGKFVSVGQAKDELSPFQTPLLAVIGFHADGTLDAAFGQMGVTTTRIGYGAFSSFGALQPDGKIIVVGQANLGSGLWYAWARYHPDGKIDSTFSDNGTTTLSTPGTGVPTCVTILPDGKILTGGVEVGSDPGAKFLICRLLPNGEVDATFGVNGRFSHWFGNYFETISDIAVLPDGKILAGGWVGANSIGDAAFLRLMPNGNLDPTFGNNGLLIMNLSGVSNISAIDVLSNGKMVATGIGYNPSVVSDVAYVMRLHPDGSFDNSFNSTGVGTISVGDKTGADEQIIQLDGKILIGGVYYSTDTTPPQIMLARVLNDGLNATHAPTIIRQCSVSPNPSSGFVTMRYELEQSTQIGIKIYNMLGRCVQIVLNQTNFPAGENATQIDISQLPSGHYQISLESSFGTESVRLVK